MPDREARHEALTATYAPRLRAALVRQVEPVLARLEQLHTLTPSAVLVLAASIQAGAVPDVLARLYEACGTADAAETYATLTAGQKAAAPAGVKDSWAQRLRRFISTEGAQAVRGITATTRGIVRRVLTESVDAGEGIADAARRLRTAVGAFARTRSVTIARTELVSASNYGSLLGAQATGLRLEKFWIATNDGRTRPDHVAANGQGAPLQEGFFTVGGHRARYPGDPLLPAAERCNCRCTVGYRRF